MTKFFSMTISPHSPLPRHYVMGGDSLADDSQLLIEAVTKEHADEIARRLNEHQLMTHPESTSTDWTTLTPREKLLMRHILEMNALFRPILKEFP